MKSMVKWNEEELKVLKLLYPSEASKEEILKVLDRSWASIGKQARVQNLKRGIEKEVKVVELEKLKRKYGI